MKKYKERSRAGRVCVVFFFLPRRHFDHRRDPRYRRLDTQSRTLQRRRAKKPCRAWPPGVRWSLLDPTPRPISTGTLTSTMLTRAASSVSAATCTLSCCAYSLVCHPRLRLLHRGLGGCSIAQLTDFLHIASCFLYRHPLSPAIRYTVRSHQHRRCARRSTLRKRNDRGKRERKREKADESRPSVCEPRPSSPLRRRNVAICRRGGAHRSDSAGQRLWRCTHR